MENAILALVTKSANDVATVVAENLGGSEDQFAAMMTAKAHGLGMANTVFRNASGLPEPYQVTTARDMATLGLALINNFPHHYHYFSTDKFYYDGAWHRNHNRLLDTYAGVDGLKTGYTRAAGFNLVASAVRDGRRVIGVVLGARSPGERGRTMASLLDAGFGNESGATQYAEKQAFTPVAYVQPRDLPQTVATRQTMAAAIGPRVLSASRRDRIEPAPASDEWMIQVGAFGSRSGAVAAAQRARDIASRSAATGTVDVVAKSDGRRRGKTVYFARLGGLSEKQVKAACQEIRRRKSACVSIAPERTVARKDDSPETPSKARFVRAPEPAPPAKARKANRASVSAVKKPWGVQVGAFPAYRSAVQHAQKARKSAPASLVDGDIEVAQVTASGAKKLYRARITGIDREAAQHACRVLESKDMDCIVFSM
jgi:D-alanyl-D-alanine carboxypeptidase